MACLSLPGHAIYQSVPDYECGCETNGDGQSHFDINFSPAIWQGDSDILISFEGCNLFREKSFLSGGTYVVKKSQATLNVTSLSR